MILELKITIKEDFGICDSRKVVEKMSFNSITFLFLFLPASLVLYYTVPGKMKRIILLLVSLLFFAAASPQLVPLLVISVVVDHFIALKISTTDSKFKKWYLLFGLTINIGLLIYYKYANFFIGELNKVSFIDISWTEVVLPLGISFFTFKKISYIVDIYQGVTKPLGFLKYFLYVIFFPQLPAGPIARTSEFNEGFSINNIYEGMWRLSLGLFKKIVMADTIAKMVNEIFALPLDNLTTFLALLGAFSYTIQIYLDFSGYTDIAIGITKLFGYNSPENFDLPYLSKSITEFWRRWHMTLSRFFKDYVYIPLGGNRCSKLRTLLNLWIVFLLTGIWHGANWTFIFWGMYHGALLTMERLFYHKFLKINSFIKQCIAFCLIGIGWVLFRSDSITNALVYLKVMFGANTVTNIPYLTSMTNESLIILSLGFLISFVNMRTLMGTIKMNTYYKGTAALVLLIFSIIALSTSNFSPFIYFKF